MSFHGFPRGTLYTPVPNPLFGPLLEAIEDLTELKCTLRALWVLHQKKGYPRFITSGELAADPVLLKGLKGIEGPPKDSIRHGMKMAVARGSFLSLEVDLEGRLEELFLLNDEPGQRAVAMIQRGDTDLKGVVPRAEMVGEPTGPRPNIFTLYEQNIGILTPILAEEMKETELSYPWPWIEEAFKIAAGRNKRSWRYIEATLRRWAGEGKDDGESGRYSQKAPAKERLVEYLRERGRLPES